MAFIFFYYAFKLDKESHFNCKYCIKIFDWFFFFNNWHVSIYYVGIKLHFYIYYTLMYDTLGFYFCFLFLYYMYNI